MTTEQNIDAGAVKRVRVQVGPSTSSDGSPLTKVSKPSPLPPKTASTSVNDVINLTSSPAQDYSLPSSTQQAQHTDQAAVVQQTIPPIDATTPPTSGGGQEYTDVLKRRVVTEVTVDLVSPKVVSSRHKIPIGKVRRIVKAAGHKLPGRYRITAESTTPTPATDGPSRGPAPGLGGKATNVFTTDEEDALSDQGQKSLQVGASNIVLSTAVRKPSNPTPHVTTSSEGRMMKEVEDLVGYPNVNLLDTDSNESDGDLPNLETSHDQYGGVAAVETSRAHGASSSTQACNELCLVCLDEPIHPVVLSCNHQYCYLCAKGLIEGGNSLCSMCRRPIPRDFLKGHTLKSEGGASTKKSASNDVPSASWYYQAGNGRDWWQFEERNSQDLESWFKEVGRSGSVDMLICGQIYVMDFRDMTQRRKNGSGRIRRIRREADEEKDTANGGVRCIGVAGIKKASI